MKTEIAKSQPDYFFEQKRIKLIKAVNKGRT